MVKKVSIEEMCKELEEASDYEGTELGEMWCNLVRLWNNNCYLGEPFKKTLEAYIKYEYMGLKENFEWVEKEVTTVKTVKSLELKQ